MQDLGFILLVDDDPATNFLNQLLIKDMGLNERLHICLGGQEALDFLAIQQSKKPQPEVQKKNLVLLDVNMPAMNGFEFLEELPLKSINRQELSIYMLTSSSFHKDIETAKRLGVDGFINKPLTDDTLKKIFNELFD